MGRAGEAAFNNQVILDPAVRKGSGEDRASE